MNGSERVWRRADLALQVALARGLSIRATAQVAGVSESTVRRRRRNPAFRAEVERRREELAAELVRLTASDLAGPRQRDTGHAVGAEQMSQTDTPAHTEAATNPSPIQPTPPPLAQQPQQDGAQESWIAGSVHVAEAQPRRHGVAAAPRPKPATVAPGASRIGSAKHETPAAEKGELPHLLPYAAVAAGMVGLYIVLHRIGATEYYRDHKHAPPPERTPSTPNVPRT